MKTIAKSTKYTNLDNLISEVLYKDTETVLMETLKSFLQFKLDLEIFEANKFTSHLKKSFPDLKKFTLKQILNSIKNTNSLDSSNPFENNILSDFPKIKALNDFDKSYMIYYIDKVSEWIFKVAKSIETNNIHLTNRLTELYFDSDGNTYAYTRIRIYGRFKIIISKNEN